MPSLTHREHNNQEVLEVEPLLFGTGEMNLADPDHDSGDDHLPEEQRGR